MSKINQLFKGVVVAASFFAIIGSAFSQPVEDRFVIEQVDGSTDPQLIPDAMVVTIFISTILQASDGSNMESFSQIMDVDLEDMEILVRIAKSLFFEFERNGRVSLANMCNSEEFNRITQNKVDYAGFVAEIDELEESIESHKVQYFNSEINKYFDQELLDHVYAWMNSNIRQNVHRVVIDKESRARAKGPSVFSRYADICNSL